MMSMRDNNVRVELALVSSMMGSMIEHITQERAISITGPLPRDALS